MADHDLRHATGTQQATSTEVVNEESNAADFGSNAQNTANTPPVDPVEGSALTPEQAARVNELVECTKISLDAYQGVASAVPEGLAPAARYAAEMATLTSQMVEDDAAALSDTSPEEGGALAAQLQAGCDELADVANVVESYAWLAEARTEYEVTALIMQGVLLAAAAEGIGPELKHAAEVTDRLDALRDRALEMLRDVAKSIVEDRVSDAADLLIHRLAFIGAASTFGPTPMGLLVYELGTFYGGMGKDCMLGKVFGEDSPESLAASAVSTASTTRDHLDKVNTVAHGFARADATLSLEVLDGAESFLGAAGDQVETTEQLLALLSVVRELVGAVREAQSARADLAAAMAALGPVLGLARAAVHETLVDLAEQVAAAARDVDWFEGEWRGR